MVAKLVVGCFPIEALSLHGLLNVWTIICSYMFEGKGNNPALETIAPFSGTVHQNQLGFQMCMF